MHPDAVSIYGQSGPTINNSYSSLQGMFNNLLSRDWQRIQSNLPLENFLPKFNPNPIGNQSTAGTDWIWLTYQYLIFILVTFMTYKKLDDY